MISMSPDDMMLTFNPYPSAICSILALSSRDGSSSVRRVSLVTKGSRSHATIRASSESLSCSTAIESAPTDAATIVDTRHFQCKHHGRGRQLDWQPKAYLQVKAENETHAHCVKVLRRERPWHLSLH